MMSFYVDLLISQKSIVILLIWCSRIMLSLSLITYRYFISTFFFTYNRIIVWFFFTLFLRKLICYGDWLPSLAMVIMFVSISSTSLISLNFVLLLQTILGYLVAHPYGLIGSVLQIHLLFNELRVDCLPFHMLLFLCLMILHLEYSSFACNSAASDFESLPSFHSHFDNLFLFLHPHPLPAPFLPNILWGLWILLYVPIHSPIYLLPFPKCLRYLILCIIDNFFYLYTHLYFL